MSKHEGKFEDLAHLCQAEFQKIMRNIVSLVHPCWSRGAPAPIVQHNKKKFWQLGFKWILLTYFGNFFGGFWEDDGWKTKEDIKEQKILVQRGRWHMGTEKHLLIRVLIFISRIFRLVFKNPLFDTNSAKNSIRRQSPVEIQSVWEDECTHGWGCWLMIHDR